MLPALQDWLPEGDLVWFLLDAVAQLKLAAMLRRCLGNEMPGLELNESISAYQWVRSWV
ncbi:MAG: hypothetical protein AAB308_05200 [Nitrospirota bacterium]